MARTIHVCQSVRGALSMPPAEFERFAASLVSESGERVTVEYARDALFDQLAMGHEVLPIGERCDRWDWKTGCKGHDTPEKEPQ